MIKITIYDVIFLITYIFIVPIIAYFLGLREIWEILLLNIGVSVLTLIARVLMAMNYITGGGDE